MTCKNLSVESLYRLHPPSDPCNSGLGRHEAENEIEGIENSQGEADQYFISTAGLINKTERGRKPKPCRGSLSVYQ